MLSYSSAHEVVRTNANAALVFEYCYRLISIAKSYFGKVDEESVKNNFALIYELIDGVYRPTWIVGSLIRAPEIIDFGYPQNSEADTLKTYITTESIVSSAYAAVLLCPFTCWTITQCRDRRNLQG